MMNFKKNKRVAIVNSQNNAPTETFVKAQVDFLPADLYIHTGWLPWMIGDKDIIHSYLRHLDLFFKLIVKRDIHIHDRVLLKIFKKEKIEAVLAQYGPGGCAMMWICKKANIPLFVHFLGFDASHKPTLETYSEKYKELFIQAKGIIVVSNKMRETLIELGCPTNKITLNYCGPNDNFFKLNPNYSSHVFVGVSSFVDKKAPYLTVLAFLEVLKKYHDAKLIIAGKGELLCTCKKIVKAYGIENSVSFPGVLKPEECMLLYEDALAFVHHSVIADDGDSEGTPVAILEASAAGLPVISTYHAGIPDVIINNETGFLVNECDIYGMAEAMIKLLDNKDLAKSMGSAGKKRIKDNFTMERYISKLRNLIDNE